MQQHSVDPQLNTFLSLKGASRTPESELLARIISYLVAEHGSVNNKHIIMFLLTALEQSDSDTEIELMRRTLEIVVGYTPDDEGF